jgi:hypothetical protein
LGKRSYNTLKKVGLPNDMDNSHMLSIIERKMCADDRKFWSRDIEKDKKTASIIWLNDMDECRDEVHNESVCTIKTKNQTFNQSFKAIPGRRRPILKPPMLSL